MEKLSTVIMTFNESAHIGRCIESVLPFSDEVLVVDSFSTDDTVKIAKMLNATVLQNKFEGYIEQRKFCIEKATYPLVFVIDADEAVSEELKIEIFITKKNQKSNGYLINRLNSIGNIWIHYGGWHPDWKLRLFFRDKIKVVGEQPHDKIILNDKTKPQKLKGNLLHYSDANLTERNETVNKHSTSAAQHLFNQGKRTNVFRIILKPLYRFVLEYFFKLGFMDGLIGYFVAKSNAQYVFLREMKLWELWKIKKHE